MRSQVGGPELDRVRAAVAAARTARAELLAALVAADRAGVSRNQLARECDGFMSRPTVLDVLKRNDEEVAKGD